MQVRFLPAFIKKEYCQWVLFIYTLYILPEVIPIPPFYPVYYPPLLPLLLPQLRSTHSVVQLSNTFNHKHCEFLSNFRKNTFCLSVKKTIYFVLAWLFYLIFIMKIAISLVMLLGCVQQINEESTLKNQIYFTFIRIGV